MFGRGKRERIAHLLERCGVLRLLENSPFTDSLLVLSYNRVLHARDCPFDRGAISASPDQFYEQASYCKSRFQVTGLPELLDHLESGKPLGGFRTMLTFDDGYIDHYQNVFPILRSLGLPALFFLPTSYIDTSRVPWWDQIAHLLRRSRKQTISLDYPEPCTLTLSEASLEESIRHVLRLYKSPAVRDSERFFEMLERECGMARLEIANPPLFLTWEHAREMLAGGMHIGSHTHSHRTLEPHRRGAGRRNCASPASYWSGISTLAWFRWPFRPARSTPSMAAPPTHSGKPAIRWLSLSMAALTAEAR
jgi:peptidoglycan/xylan/chitin deacetylase (PgdA/CDA1 family)